MNLTKSQPPWVGPAVYVGPYTCDQSHVLEMKLGAPGFNIKSAVHTTGYNSVHSRWDYYYIISIFQRIGCMGCWEENSLFNHINFSHTLIPGVWAIMHRVMWCLTNSALFESRATTSNAGWSLFSPQSKVTLYSTRAGTVALGLPGKGILVLKETVVLLYTIHTDTVTHTHLLKSYS